LIKDYRVVGEAPQMGRNLFVKSDSYLSTWGTNNGTVFSNSSESGYSSSFDFLGVGGFEVKYIEADLTDGQEYTFSFDFTRPAYAQWTAGQGLRLELRSSVSDVGNISSVNVLKTLYLPYDAGTSRVTFTFTAPSNNVYLCLNFGYVADGGTAKRFTFANFKMEFGTTATAWTAAPEDSSNLLLNSTFNNALSNWSLSSAWQQVLPPESDKPRANILRTFYSNYDGNSPRYHSERWPVKADGTEKVTISFDIRAESIDSISNSIITFRLADTSTGAYTTSFNTISRNHLINGGIVAGVWYRYSTTIPIPNHATSRWLMTGLYNSAGTVDFQLRELKLEWGETATAWTAAPEDISMGIDRQPLAMGQHTIVDYNDSVGLTATISSNHPLTQKYNPVAQAFSPDYKTSNLILTASLFKNSSTENIIDDGNVKSIKWFRKIPNDEIEVTGRNDSFYKTNGKTLTRKDNLENDYSTMEFRVNIVYTDSISAKDITVNAAITMNIVVDSGGLIQSEITLNGSPKLRNGKPEFVRSSDSKYGRNLLLNTRYFQNTSRWGLSMGAGGVGTISLVDDPVYGKVIKGICTTPSGWWVLGNYYSGYWKKKFSIGAQYSVTIMIKSTMGVNVGFMDGNGTQSALPTKGISSTGGAWTEVKWTYTAIGEGNATQVYINIPNTTSTGEIYIAYIKLEEGPESTGWSMNPDERPSVTQATGQDKWLWRRYKLPAAIPMRAPVYEDIKNVLMNDEKLINEGSTLFQNTTANNEDYYIGYIGTAVYTPYARTLPVSFHVDDSVSIYVNNTRVSYKPDGQASGTWTATVNLVAGWNTLEFLYYEATGADGIWNFATTQKQILRDAANLDGYVTYPGNEKGIKKGDGLYRFPLNSGTNELLNPDLVSVLQGTTYTMSFLFRTDSTDLTFQMAFFDGTNEVYAPMVVDLGTSGESTGILTDPTVTDSQLESEQQLKKAYVVYNMQTDKVRAFMLKNITFTNGTYIDIIKPKLEIGTAPTEFSLAPEDVAPSILKTHVQKVNVFYVTPFESYLQNLTATCKLWRSSVIDETNVTYQWFKQDDSILTDQGGGIGWLKLTSSSLESGYNLQTLVIPGDAVDEKENYKCIVTDVETGSNTLNQKFPSMVTVVNIVDPIEVRVTSTNGETFHNGQGETNLTAHLFRKDMELDMTGTEYTYKWYKYNQDGTKDNSWDNVGYKEGKVLTITPADLAVKATFSVEVMD
jgi:hypothetical protein